MWFIRTTATGSWYNTTQLIISKYKHIAKSMTVYWVSNIHIREKTNINQIEIHSEIKVYLISTLINISI